MKKLKPVEAASPPQTSGAPNVDLREQTFNRGLVGPITVVSTPVEQIGQIQSVMYDIDLKLFNPDGLFSPEGLLPDEFYRRYVASWLERHPTLRKAEVRFTGSGFHVLLHFSEPVLLDTTNLLRRWRGIVQIVQAALPIDPQQPTINALTRPVGSVNSKNGETVRLLRRGTPVTEQEVLTLSADVGRCPFPMLMQIWFGGHKTEPCPVCRVEGSYLEAFNAKKGRCYGKCKKQVSINTLVKSILITKISTKKEKA